MRYKKIINAILPLLFLFMVTSAVAGPVDPEEDADQTTDALDPAPISDYIIPMLILGVGTAFALLRTKTVHEST